MSVDMKNLKEPKQVPLCPGWNHGPMRMRTIYPRHFPRLNFWWCKKCELWVPCSKEGQVLSPDGCTFDWVDSTGITAGLEEPVKGTHVCRMLASYKYVNDQEEQTHTVPTMKCATCGRESEVKAGEGPGGDNLVEWAQAMAKQAQGS